MILGTFSVLAGLVGTMATIELGTPSRPVETSGAGLGLHIMIAQDGTESLEFQGVVDARSDSARAATAAIDRARLLAIRRALASTLVRGSWWDGLSTSVRNAVDSLVIGYVENRIQLRGPAVGQIVEVEGRATTVSLRIPASLLAPHAMTLERLIEVGMERIRADEAGFFEAACLFEVIPDGDPRREALAGVLIPTGGAVESSRAGSWGEPPESWSSMHSAEFGIWTRPLRKFLQQDLQLPVRPSISYGNGISPWHAENPPMALDDLVELATGSRSAPAVLAAAARRLALAGWTRTAAILCGQAEFPSTPPMPVKRLERSESKRRALLQVFETPQLIRQYLSEGEAPVIGTVTPGTEYRSAASDFNKGSEDGYTRALSSIAAAALLRPLAVDEWSLLAAMMLAWNEPELARAFARTAYSIRPSHRYAGVNLLRAAQRLGLATEVRDLLPQLEANTDLDDWGTRRLEETRTWLKRELPCLETEPPQ